MTESGLMKNKPSTSYKCLKCKDTGYISIRENGYEYVTECECGLLARERMKGKLQFADIPIAFRNMRLETFRTDIYKGEDSKRIIERNIEVISYYIDNFPLMKKEGLGLFLYSNKKGSGKTRMITSIANTLIEKQGATVKFSTSIQLIDEIKATWDKGNKMSEHQLLKDLSKTEVLIIDDFGIEAPKDWLMERFYHVINTRYINNMITMFTSNTDIKSLQYDERITNRILEKCIALAFPEESIREYIFQSNMKKIGEASKGYMIAKNQDERKEK